MDGGKSAKTQSHDEMLADHLVINSGTMVSSTMFCFTILVPFDSTFPLLRAQFERKVGIFGCDGYAVFNAGKSILLNGHGNAELPFSTHSLKESLVAPGIDFKTLPDTDTIMAIAVWKAVAGMSTLETWKWVVRVDPEVVFFPNRFRRVLSERDAHCTPVGVPKGRRLHLHNCQSTITYLSDCNLRRGLVEVLSNDAVSAFDLGMAKCGEDFHDSGPSFTDQCFKSLGILRDLEYGLFNASDCRRHGADCKSKSMAFHPLKTVRSQKRCERDASMRDSQADILEHQLTV